MTRDEAKAFCERRALSGVSFTSTQLKSSLIRENGGLSVVSDGINCKGIAEDTIRRLWHDGKIDFVRNGRERIFYVVSKVIA